MCQFLHVSRPTEPDHIFSVKIDIWNRDGLQRTVMHSVASWKGQLALKDCVLPAIARRVTEKQEASAACFVSFLLRALCCFGRSPGVSVSLWEKQPLNPTEPLSSLPNGSARCYNLFSAWPDYCLLHIVWWPASGSTGEGDSALICCYIRKITFLLMYPSGHELCLVVCRLCFQKEL